MNTIKKCKFALKAVISGKLGLNFSEELKVWAKLLITERIREKKFMCNSLESEKTFVILYLNLKSY
jgi:hypothetical protein